MVSGMLLGAGTLAYFLVSRRAWGGLKEGLKEGAYWQERLDRLEAEVKRLRDGETRLELEDQVRRLDEKVEFLEALLAERPKPGALPAGDTDDSGADRR